MNTMILDNNLDLLQTELLPKKFMEEYDIEKSISNVKDFFKKYRRLKYKVMFGPQLRITTQYKLVWVDESHRNDSESLDNFIEVNEEYIKISKQLEYINKTSLSEEESIFMICYLLKEYSYYRTREIIGCAQATIDNISRSCFLKLAMGLNIEVLK